MGKFDEYTYGRTLRFFEAYYPYDTEDVHYDEVMLSMSQCKTIEELIAVRERLKEKAEKVRSYTILDKIPQNIIDELSRVAKMDSVLYQDKTYRIKSNIESDANSCYDENLFRLFKESKEITESSCGECFVNMTNCVPNSAYYDKIVTEAKERADLDVSGLLNTIARRYKEFGDHWRVYNGFKEGMNGYNAAKKAVEDDLEYLKKFNWRLLPKQRSLYSKIDRVEIRKAVEAEVKKRKENRKWAIAKIIIGVILFVGVMALLVQIPGVVWNWIIAFLLWLAIMKSLLK